jgi:hypothetical protein
VLLRADLQDPSSGKNSPEKNLLENGIETGNVRFGNFHFRSPGVF